MTAPARPVDVQLTDLGSIVGFKPLTAAARDWFEDHGQVKPWRWLHGTLFVDPRCARPLVAALAEDGLYVRQDGRHSERGAVLLLVALLLPVLIVFLGLTVDTGWMCLCRAEAQNSADAAALAAASYFFHPKQRGCILATSTAGGHDHD